MKKGSIDQIIYDETKKRLDEMERTDYEFPKKAGKGDYIGIALCVGISIVLIVLCMTGVIG